MIKQNDRYLCKNKEIKEGDYLFSLEIDKESPISQPNFSKKIEEVFIRCVRNLKAQDFKNELDTCINEDNFN